ncbi:hypothetical protein IFR05_011907 [Cadophora sp. M221]|nr:hypothetical protein IFR05_011907 [Cadophora sp. M221]
MTSLESFSLFSLLSPELRLQIWHEALLIPRLVFIWKHNSGCSNLVQRSVASPLLCVNQESRNEALRAYSRPISYPPSLEKPVYIGPGTDIVYIAGIDGDRRAFKNVTWTCDFLSQDLDSEHPSFSPLRRLAVDEEFLQQTPFLQFNKMPYSVWKLLISDLQHLEELIVVRREAEHPWTVSEVEVKLALAREKFLVFWEDMCTDEAEIQALMKWRMPLVRIMTPEELVAICWV